MKDREREKRGYQKMLKREKGQPSMRERIKEGEILREWKKVQKTEKIKRGKRGREREKYRKRNWIWPRMIQTERAKEWRKKETVNEQLFSSFSVILKVKLCTIYIVQWTMYISINAYLLEVLRLFYKSGTSTFVAMKWISLSIQ